MKPKLKPPGTKGLELKCDILLSTSAFKFNLRRYSTEILHAKAAAAASVTAAAAVEEANRRAAEGLRAGAYTRSR
jgi:hypothetical protein